MDTLQFLSQDSEARRLYEARQKYLHDEASMLDRAESVGITIGRLITKRSATKNLIKMGFELPTIARITELTEHEIKAIQI
ncbi:hypothetical protein ACIFQM_22780 [Paenibacillus sp. NRS-1782]|uniref:hypothetical protein n=1 Tax=unclassified Paenibacillus TaxID=185978 RepID=UPI003D2E0BE5